MLQSRLFSGSAARTATRDVTNRPRYQCRKVLCHRCRCALWEVSALLADSLDNLGDALTYSLSLYAVSRGAAVKAKVALLKGGLILLAAFAVVAQIAYKLVVQSEPVFEVMGIFSLLGLAANSICLFLLWRHRQEDVNMSSCGSAREMT